ncbi:MAG: winged helix DNA-binding domain-containing protein [Actinobacteria bacterium]|nr:winged helix DNA-binding domain-containing protein [Actinomycetota bacterium]
MAYRARAPTVATVVERLIGVQAQDLAFARLAFRPCCSHAVVAANVDAALPARALVWTWAMRGTLRLVSAHDTGWLTGLLGPIFAERVRPRRLALGRDDERYERTGV